MSRKSGTAVHRIPIQQQRFRAGWLWSSVGVLLTAAVVAIWIARPERQSSCAATHSGPDIGTGTSRMMVVNSSAGGANRHPVDASSPTKPGEARYYSFGPGAACSFAGLPTNGFYVGVSTREYGHADLCGAYLDVHGPRGDVRVLVADRCPGCAPGQLDLSTAAFEQIADRSDGVAQIRYSVVRDPLPPPELSYELEPDSSASWLAMQVTGSGNPIQRIALRAAAGGPWHELDRGMDNYWTISGAGPGPFSAQVTDVHGHQVEITGIALEQGRRYAGLQLYSEPDPEPSPTPTPESTAKTPQSPSSVAATGCRS
ncbi:expansin EXLX1 family cellulose-binding protein [Nocardia sp. NPDC051990]|uniref:expansin EXLX1 family cellulose-binding protein n=1 Tax=Nocardia sp. NPDC051990 TaxID=3155285 RepID=UPI0034272653